MNNKAFTLIELLAVVILLSIIVFLVLPNVVNLLKDEQKEIDELTYTIIKDATKLYIEDNKELYKKTSGNKYCISLNKLVEKGYLKDNIKYDGEDITNLMSVQISYDSGYDYSVVDSDKCEVLPKICTLISGKAKTIGAQYTCEVKEGINYNFYVLSHNEDGTINLIMDQNICEDGSVATAENTCLIPWLNNTDYLDLGGQDLSNDGEVCQHLGICSRNDKGPVTAMKYLYNATKNWTNIEPINYTYKDRESQGITKDGVGYTSFVSKKGIAVITPLLGSEVVIGSEEEPLRARMPIYSKDATKTEVANLNESNTYLYKNLEGVDGSKIYGYWTLSSSPNDYVGAWFVEYDGGVYNYLEHFREGYDGVRPVITVNL